MYVILISLPPGRQALVYYLPLGIHFFSGTAEYLITVDHALIKIPSVKSIMYAMKANRNLVIMMKQKIEIYLTLYTIVGVFFGLSSIIHIFYMYNYISGKTLANQFMQTAQQQFIYSIESFTGSPKCPSILKFILGKFMWAYKKLIKFQ